MKYTRYSDKLTKFEQLEMGMFITFLEASILLNCTIQNISKLVREGRLERVVYKKRQYITLTSILVYSGCVDTGDVIVFTQRVNFKPRDYQEVKRRKEIKILEKEEWSGF